MGRSAIALRRKRAKEAAAKVKELAIKKKARVEAKALADKKAAFAKETAERNKAISEAKQGNKKASGSIQAQQSQERARQDQASRAAQDAARKRSQEAAAQGRERAKAAAAANVKAAAAKKVAEAKAEAARIAGVQEANKDREDANATNAAKGLQVGPTADREDATKDVSTKSSLLDAIQEAPENTRKNILASDTTTEDRVKALRDFTTANQEWQKAVRNKADPNTIAALKKTYDEYRKKYDTSVYDENKAVHYVNDIKELDDLAALENNQLEAVKSGKDDKILQAEQELLRKKEKDEAVKAQIAAEEAAQRTLFREQQAAELAGQELDRSANALARQKDAITRTLDAETRSFNEQQRQLAAEGVQLDRAEGTVKRRGQIAGRSADTTAAASANMAAQSGFGSSSAALGAQASAKSTAATQAGDILTKLVDVESARTTLGVQGDLLGKSFLDLQNQVSDSYEQNADQLDQIKANKFKLATRQEDIGIEQQNLRNTLSSNLDFLQDTFNLGGSISGAAASINAANAATAKRDQEKAAALSLGISGVTAAATMGPAGAVIGGVLIVKALSDYFDF